MLSLITDCNNPLLEYIKDDPVRPEIPKEFRVMANNFVVCLHEESKPKAIVCVSLHEDIPNDVTGLSEISTNPKVTLLFPWYPMERQVSVVGTASKISEEESAAYFVTRPRGSQIGAWASSQSEKLSSRQELEKRFAEIQARFPNEVPKPPHWGGYLVTPISFEFWQGRYSRLHDRFLYSKNNSNWEITRLNP